MRVAEQLKHRYNEQQRRLRSDYIAAAQEAYKECALQLTDKVNDHNDVCKLHNANLAKKKDRVRVAVVELARARKDLKSAKLRSADLTRKGNQINNEIDRHNDKVYQIDAIKKCSARSPFPAWDEDNSNGCYVCHRNYSPNQDSQAAPRVICTTNGHTACAGCAKTIIDGKGSIQPPCCPECHGPLTATAIPFRSRHFCFAQAN